MIFNTQFSVYEIDQKEKKIRKLSGACDPTPRQGAMGEWKEYHRIGGEIKVGAEPFIHWDDEGHGTWLSRVKSIGRTA